MTRKPRTLKGKRIVSSVKMMMIRKLDIYMQKAEIDYLTPFIKINLKWIKNLNIRPETVKCLDENIAEKLLDIGFGNNF